MSDRKKQLHISDGGAIIEIGKAGENSFRTVEFDISGWAENDADYRIIYSRPDGMTYPLPSDRQGNILSWTPEAYDLECTGFGKLEVRAYIDDIIGKSETFKVNIAESIQTDETNPDAARPDWVNDIIDKVVIKSIEQSKISDEDGGENVLTVTLTDGSTTDFRVRNGAKGDRGDKGEKGEPGENGYTPLRGVDYWTEADKTEIAESVDAYTKEETMTEIEVYVGNELDVLYRIVDPHIADNENPHGVTAEQVGTYSKGEIDVFVSDLGEVSARLSDLEAKLGDIDAALDELLSSDDSLTGGTEQ